MKRETKIAGAAVMAALGSNFAHAQGTERLKVGLIGCGGRGNGAVNDVLAADKGVEIWAVGDAFEDKAKASADKFKVPASRCFAGLDAYKGVLESGVDYVILATPPGFRPVHLKAAVEAGKHVFMEKPVAVCPTGVRMVLAAAEQAQKKNLGIVAGTQRRHQASYVETIKRLHEGAIGEILTMSVYWCQGGMWHVPRKEGWSDLDWQLRNWQYFTWLGGDHIVEQHIHNIDVACWVLRATPISAYGSGGRQARTGPEFGHIFDHFGVEFEFPNDVRVKSLCRQIDGCDNVIGEYVAGTEGRANPGGSIDGKVKWRYEGPPTNPYVQEHADLIKSIRDGKPLNEGRQVAESTMAAIMGRMTCYTGKRISWDAAMKSKLDLVPGSGIDVNKLPVWEEAKPGKETFWKA